METRALDTKKIQAFADQVVGILNGGLTSLMLSIGHRTGLFDRLATLGSVTSSEIATASQLDERYVREWLASLVTARIIDYDGRHRTYRLPPEHAACLTREAGPNNLALFAQGVGQYGAVENAILGCFKSGGGIPYDSYPHFHDFAAEMSGVLHDALLVTKIIPTVGMAARLTAGIDVLDVGCGKGHALNLLAKAFPNSRFVGIDLCEETVAAARAETAKFGLANARFEQMDAAKLDSPATYDFITAFDTIHDQADPARVLSRIREALRPGGTFLCVDIAASSHLADNLGHPLAPTLYAVSTMHCTPVSLAQGGVGLGTMWGQETALQMLGQAGFADVHVQRVEGDLMNNYYVARS
ncbi:MAG TPA: methyltransferase domain-containing protein [Polyangiaceae bacterium]|nr:methyltransferase domain-containing protein [Polyangiaceae bacterium]